MTKQFAVLALALALAACSQTVSPPPLPTAPGNPWIIGPIIGGKSFSPGMPLQPTCDPECHFDFPAQDGVHSVTRKAAGLPVMSLHFAVSGSATGFLEVDCGSPGCVPGPAKVRLFLQRNGDNWSGTGPLASYRFCSTPIDLAMGEQVLTVPLDPASWTNMVGQTDPAGLTAAVSDLDVVGFEFGGMFCGHGAYAVGGSARFTIHSWQ